MDDEGERMSRTPAGAATRHERDLAGRTVAVTGASSGIGYFIAEGLADRGASVILLGRSPGKLSAALGLLRPGAPHRALLLDLEDLDSIHSAGRQLRDADALDGLVLNAGIIAAAADRRSSVFGVEATIGVNVLAHLELLSIAFPALERAPEARVVSTGSILTKRIPFDRDDWLSERSYAPRVAYAMSRHAAEIAGFELDRRLAARGSRVASPVTHPGGAIDALTPDRPGVHRRSTPTRIAAGAIGPLFSRIVQGKDRAAGSALHALTVRHLPRSSYIGPRHGAAGGPVLSEPVRSSLDAETGSWLWQRAEAHLGHPILETTAGSAADD